LAYVFGLFTKKYFWQAWQLIERDVRFFLSLRWSAVPGVEYRYHSVGELFSEPRLWTIACTECRLSKAVTVTEAITIYGGDDYRSEHLKTFVQRCPKRRTIAECSGHYDEG
jgi:hypothetical protein